LGFAAVRVVGKPIVPKNFSNVDKQILKILLDPKGYVSSRLLAERLGLPRSTVQRRRSQLEKNHLDLRYSLNLGNLGYRRVDLLIYTERGSTQAIAKRLLTCNEVVYVGRSIGEHTIDLRAEVVIKDNSELLELLELVKAVDDVKDVIWSEIVDVMGVKRSVPATVIDRL
jgi:DNA-binding Lrp family transcriptional regulator